MKKLFALLLLFLTISVTNIIFASDTQESIQKLLICREKAEQQFEHKAKYQYTVKQIEDMNFQEPSICLHAIKFGSHLTTTFPGEISNLVCIAFLMNKKEGEKIRHDFHQASKNFNLHQYQPKVSPAGKTIAEYLEQLKNLSE